MRVPLIHRPDEFAAARTAVEPASAKAMQSRPPLPLGAPARATAAMAELRAAESSPAEQIRHAIDMALAPLSALLETPPTDPRYKHRAFLVVDNANEQLAKLHTGITHALDNTWWSVIGPVNNAAAELAALAPLTAKAVAL